MKIRIGNLNRMTTQQQLADLFFPFGRVISSKIQASNSKGRLGRIGLIEMSSKCGQMAIRNLHLVLFMNSYIEVDEVFG